MYPAGGGELFVHRAPDQREELASLLERQSQSVVIDIVPHHPQATPPLTCAPLLHRGGHVFRLRRVVVYRYMVRARVDTS